MERRLKYLLPAALLAGTMGLGSCIHDSYDDCPTEGNVEIAMTYYWHNKGNEDLFGKEVNRAELYIFDKAGLFYRRDVVENSQFTNGYRHRLNLPGGEYSIVSWGDGGTKWQPEELIPGVTTLEDARMKLAATPVTRAGGGAYVVEEMPEDLFFGEMRKQLITVKNGKTVRDSIDLKKMTQDIRVRLRWKDSNGAWCTEKVHEELARPYLEIMNGEYDFAGKPKRERFLTYMPQLLPSEEETPIDYASVRADFRVGRLTAEGSTAKVVVAEVLPDGSVTRRYTRSLVELIRLTGHYNTQEQIDREDHFDVEIDFRCEDTGHGHANTWMVIGIRINGWVVSDIEAEI